MEKNMPKGKVIPDTRGVATRYTVYQMHMLEFGNREGAR